MQPRPGSGPSIAKCRSLTLIHRRNQDIRVLRVHHDIRTAREVIYKENTLPSLSTIGGLVDAALLITTPETAHRRHVEDIRVGWMHHNTPNMLCLLKTNLGEGCATIRGLVHPVTPARALAVVGLTGADIEDIRMALAYREVTDTAGFKVLENGLEGGAIVGGFEDATGRRRDVIGTWIRVDNGKVIDASAHDCGPNGAPWQVFRNLDLRICGGWRVDPDAGKGDSGEDKRAVGMHV